MPLVFSAGGLMMADAAQVSIKCVKLTTLGAIAPPLTPILEPFDRPLVLYA